MVVLDDLVWQIELPRGSVYSGQLNDKGKPNGFGCMGYVGREGFLESIYVGEFLHSQPHGRGYILEHHITQHGGSRRRATVEDVMMNAVYDQCGRPYIYPVEVGDIIEDEPIVTHRWLMKQDGMWQNGRFLQVVRRNFQPFKEDKLYSLSCANDSKPTWQKHKSIRLGEIGSDGTGVNLSHNVVLTPLSNSRLMVQLGAQLFTLGGNEIYEFERKESGVNRRYYFSLQPIGVTSSKEPIVEVKREGVKYLKL